MVRTLMAVMHRSTIFLASCASELEQMLTAACHWQRRGTRLWDWNYGAVYPQHCDNL